MDKQPTEQPRRCIESVLTEATAQTLSIIESYEPKLTANAWEPIAAIVRDAVRSAEPDNPRRVMALMSTVTAYVHWSHQRGDSLCDELFVVGRIEKFIADSPAQGWSSSTRSTRRSEPISVADALNGLAGSGRLCPVDRRVKPQPYTPAEVAALIRWARRQRVSNRIDACVMVGLGLGAGLTSSEICAAKAEDVVESINGLSVTVGDRVVPMVSRFDGLIREALPVRSGDQLLFGGREFAGGKNFLGKFVASCTAVQPRVSTQRMRMTWMVGRLNAGVPIDAFVKAAGLESLRTANELLKWLEPSNPAELDRSMRADCRSWKAAA